jgi:bifunctional non-homologous end joining protein LigD
MRVDLRDYHRKRNFDLTPEPRGGPVRAGKKERDLVFVVQKHRASHLHYDFRIEWRGVLLSWSVPKGPSTDPKVRRLAMATENHPIEYALFEGVIPAKEYGGGTMMVWDAGEWRPEVDDVDAALEKGDFKLTLYGQKLRGSWVLVRTRPRGDSDSTRSWLLIKHRDEHAAATDVTELSPRSVLTNRLLADIARDGGGDIDKAASADPAGSGRPTSAAIASRGPTSKPPSKRAPVGPAKKAAKTRRSKPRRALNEA